MKKQVKILMLGLVAGVGKDYLAQGLEERYGAKIMKIALATPLKNALASACSRISNQAGWSASFLSDMSCRREKEKYRPALIELANLMVGMDKDVFCRIAHSKIQSEIQEDSRIEWVIITDWRHKHEVEYFRDIYGADNVRAVAVDRNGETYNGTLYGSMSFTEMKNSKECIGLVDSIVVNYNVDRGVSAIEALSFEMGLRSGGVK